MLNIFYDSWDVICVVSIIVGLFVNLIPIYKMRNISNFKAHLIVLKNIVATLCFSLAVISGAVHLLCTKTPSVCGLSLSEARSVLRENELEDILLPNLKYDALDVTVQVTFQSVEAGGIVLKGRIVYLDFVQKENEVTNSMEEFDGISANLLEENLISNQEDNLEFGGRDERKVIVPNVIGMEQGDAIRTLYMAGLQFQVFLNSSDDFNSDTYYVLDQSYMYGDHVDIGTIVKLELVSDLPDAIEYKDFEYEQDDSSVKSTEELNGFYIYSHSVTYASFYDAATNQVSSPDYLTEKLCQVCFNITGAEDAALSIFMKGCNVGICIDNIAGISEIFINKGNYVLSADYGNYTKVVDVNVTSSGEYLINFN